MTKYTFDLDNKQFYKYVARKAFDKWIDDDEIEDYMACVHNDILQWYWDNFMAL